MSRLDYAPKLKEIQITDIKKGIGVFTPKPDKPISFAALKGALKKAGYTLDSADLTVSGTLKRDDKEWWIVADPSGQRFALEGTDAERLLAGASTGARIEITGDWQTAGEGASAREVITPRDVKKTESGAKTKTARAVDVSPASATGFMAASFDAPPASPFTGSLVREESEAIASPPAPIRVTSPGLTVYKGGAVTPRLYLVKQHLGDLEVSRQIFQLSVSYTPSPRTQLEVEVPLARTSFDDGDTSSSSTGLGNITLWSKYRFYRTVKTYGDRQAAVRFGLELPTGNKSAPGEREIDVPAFVRQQLTPINGGLSPRLDVSFSQAGGRFIFGGNVEGVLRSERAGFRTGHEVRVNTDLEYVLLPFNYEQPGKELFVILESSFVHRGIGRVNGAQVPGSNSTEYYIAPGIQYAADPRLVVEGSVQFPVVQNTGPLVLRNDRNILLGVRYLF